MELVGTSRYLLFFSDTQNFFEIRERERKRKRDRRRRETEERGRRKGREVGEVF